MSQDKQGELDDGIRWKARALALAEAATPFLLVEGAMLPDVPPDTVLVERPGLDGEPPQRVTVADLRAFNAAALDGMAREVETLRADLVATRMERDGALARIRMAEAAAADARSRIKQAGADTRRVLAEAEAKIGAATARAVAAEEALARVSERLAMACQFYVANSDVYVLRSPAGWRVLKPQSPLLDELYLNAFGIWETGSHKEPPHQFDSVDAALAALAVSRG